MKKNILPSALVAALIVGVGTWQQMQINRLQLELKSARYRIHALLEGPPITIDREKASEHLQAEPN